MAIFLPNHHNIRFLKSVLRNDFGMRSAHATEAIASLLGFRSHASFLAAGSQLTDVTAFNVDFEAFEERAAQLGYEETSSEYLHMIFKDIAWPEPAWKFFDKRDAKGRDTWFFECKKRAIPFLHIAKARKYCTVEWDHITMDSDYDQMVRKAGDGDMGQVLFKTYQFIALGAEPKSFFSGSSMVGNVKGLSDGSARQIANAFAMLLFPGNLQAGLMA